MGNIGQPTVMMVGGAVNAGGLPKGIFRVVVTGANVDSTPGNDEKPPRPFVELEFWVHKDDEDNKAKRGKRLGKQRFYGASKSDDAEKAKDMNGMLKTRVYDGLNVKWPSNGSALDPRIFLKKEAYVVVAPSKPNPETGVSRNEIQAIAQKKEKLPKKYLNPPKAEEKKEDDEE
jgi:hypothetical protein